MGDAVDGWAFLVARGRREGHRTILAPDFLVRRAAHGRLAATIGSGAASSDTHVDRLDTEAGPITVFWRTAPLSAAALKGRLGSAAKAVDDRGRPLIMVYGIVVRGRAAGEVNDEDIELARRAALACYGDFLDDEDGYEARASEAFKLRGTVTELGDTPAPEVPSPARVASRRARRPIAVVALLAGVLLVAGGLILLASGRGEPTRPIAPHVVASTSVAGALARAAGATDVRLLAPASLRSPAEYEPKETELAAARDADLVLYAPGDGFAARLRRAAPDAKLLRVTLPSSPAAISAEVMRIARRLGTTSAAARWITRFRASYRRLSASLRAGQGAVRRRVVAHRATTRWAAFAGARLVGTFGPAALTPPQVAQLKRVAPAIVLDDAASPIGRALRSLGVPIVAVSNVPGAELDIIALFERNARAIAAAMRK